MMAYFIFERREESLAVCKSAAESEQSERTDLTFALKTRISCNSIKSWDYLEIYQIHVYWIGNFVSNIQMHGLVKSFSDVSQIHSSFLPFIENKDIIST